MERKKRVVPREACAKCSERSNHCTRKRGGAERTEVSRGHSSQEAKDRINRSLEYDRERRNDRSKGDLLFSFKRCVVHFAVDDEEVHMCTHLRGEKSYFLPFNKGNNNGAEIRLILMG